ncbi:mfsd1 [Ecytonucleospora hepatopenaei]|uniref:Lysosomal dipeptide transporter MFSD1 n=1 Tax=Ecytonucleospora hepatopenaei TaxID=646526 RepID=A0A1W0E610_9MICR|nr:mfsd1 [Ecytonucleospora hepatopenaei]
MQKQNFLLIKASFALFLLYFVYDIPAAINTSIIFNNTSANAQQLSYLYAAYAMPNMIFPLISSYFYRYLHNYLVFYIVFMIIIGQKIFTNGLLNENLNICIYGRIFYGIGVESYFAFVQNRISILFKEKQVAMSINIFIAVGRMGTVFTFFISPLFIERFSIELLNNIAFYIVILATVLILLLYEKTSMDDIVQNSSAIPKSDKYAIFLLLQIIFLFACLWSPFYNIAPIMFQIRFGFDKIHASRFLCYIEGSSIFLGFLIGYFVDYFGNKIFFIMISGILIFLSHCIFMFKKGPFALAITMLAFAAPMMACYWPCISKLTCEKDMSRLIGIVMCVINTSYMLSPIVTSLLLRFDKSYFYAEEYLLVLSVLLIYKIFQFLQYNNEKNLKLNEPEIKKRSKSKINLYP